MVRYVGRPGGQEDSTSSYPFTPNLFVFFTLLVSVYVYIRKSKRLVLSTVFIMF